MKQKFSSEDIVRFLYGDMEAPEREQFLDSMLEDEALFEEFEAMQSAHAALAPVSLAPSKAAHDRVMNVAKRAAKEQRRNQPSFLSTGRERIINFHHLVSVVMVLLTCLTAAGAMYAYKVSAQPKNTWEMTETKVELFDHSLDQRLEFARHRLEGILEDREDAFVPVHHDTYRLVNTNLFAPADQEVIFLNIK